MRSPSPSLCHLLLCHLPLLWLCVPSASAQEAVGEDQYPALNVGVFGTFSGVHSSEDRADFGSSLLADGAGFTDNPSYGLDSRLGVQVTGDFSPRLSAVVQVIAEQRADGSFDPAVEWANVTYRWTPSFSVRVGRSVTPAFIVSDFRKVSYAHHWVRPPPEVYDLVPVTNSDGVDLRYQLDVGDARTTIQAMYGESEIDVPNLGSWQAKDTLGLYGTSELGDVMVRAGYGTTRLQAPAVTRIFDLFRAFGPEGQQIAETYDLRNRRNDFWTLGGSWEPGDWFFQAELARNSSSSLIGETTAGYINGALRLGGWTPYATVAVRSSSSFGEDPGLDVSRLPPTLREPATALNDVLDSFLVESGRTTVSVGLRWDVRRNMSLKLQLDHLMLDDGSTGNLVDVQPDFEPGSDLTVVTALFDFVLW